MDILNVDHLPARKWYKRTKYRVAKPFLIIGYQIPNGFITDGASVPRLLWWLFNPMGRYAKAAILHDWLLKQRKYGRKDADFLFRAAMRDLGVIAWRRWTMWAAVRLFGIVKDSVKSVLSSLKGMFSKNG